MNKLGYDLNCIRLPEGVEPEMIQTIINLESSGGGFDSKTGKIKIQFEPHQFKKRVNKPTGVWDKNKVDVQSKEWEAFNDAFKIDPNAAMESTSIGLVQIMGFHWKRLGFNSVGEMWDFFKISEQNQVLGLVKFIETDQSLLKAFINKDWHNIARLYNGANYVELAKKLGKEPYNVLLEKQYKKLKGVK